MGQFTKWRIDAKKKLRVLFEEAEAIKKKWNSPWAGIPLWLVATSYVVYWHYHVPAPGYAVGALAVVAGIMSVREIEILGRISWIVLLVCLLMTEFHAIDKDRADNEQKQKEFFAEQKTGFQGIATEVEGVITTSNKQFDATMKRSDKTISGVEGTLDAETGRKSIAVFTTGLDIREAMQGPNSPNQYLELFIVGQYPIRQLTVTVQRADPMPCARLDFLCVQSYMLGRINAIHTVPVGISDSIPCRPHLLPELLKPGRYQVDVISESGSYTEMIEVNKYPGNAPTFALKKTAYPAPISGKLGNAIASYDGSHLLIPSGCGVIPSEFTRPPH